MSDIKLNQNTDFLIRVLALGFVLALLDWRGSDIIWLFRLRCDFGLSWQTLLLLSTCGKLNRGGLFGFSEILVF